jgi:hypothetical protein
VITIADTRPVSTTFAIDRPFAGKLTSEGLSKIAVVYRLLAGQRPKVDHCPAGRTLNFGLFCHFKRVVDFDTKVPHGTLKPIACRQ